MKLESNVDTIQPKLTVVLVDPLWEGHHATYFKIFARTFLNLGCQFIALCPKPDEFYQWAISETNNLFQEKDSIYAFELQKTKPIHFPVKPFQRLLSSVIRWKAVSSAIHSIIEKLGRHPDLVFL
jgi:hypothetical protein